MILNFRVSNYKSIKEEIELSLIPSNVKGGNNVITIINSKAERNNIYKALTSVGIYGANASGKSNLIEAFYEFRKMVYESSENKPDQVIEAFKPFKLNDDSLKKATTFAMDFVINNIIYMYNIAFNSEVIVEEKLVYYPKGRELKIFEREYQEIKKGNGYKGIFESVKERTTKNQLFLTKASTENLSFAIDVVNYIHKNNILTTGLLHTDRFDEVLNDLFFLEDTPFRKQVISLINKLDTQIEGVICQDDEIYTIHVNNKGEKIRFSVKEESSGTQRIISFVNVIIMCLYTGASLIVDEFERSLHPEIAKYLLQLFNDPEINTKGAQFIFATHDVTLLSPENNLRRDQICLIEKNEKGESELYAISDIKGIREGNIEKWYLEGRLGGMPALSKETFKKGWLEFIKEEDEKKKE